MDLVIVWSRMGGLDILFSMSVCHTVVQLSTVCCFSSDLNSVQLIHPGLESRWGWGGGTGRTEFH